MLSYKNQAAHKGHVDIAFDNYDTPAISTGHYPAPGNVWTGKEFLVEFAIPKELKNHPKLLAYMNAFKRRHDQHAIMTEADTKMKQAKSKVNQLGNDMNDPEFHGKKEDEDEDEMLEQGAAKIAAKKEAIKAHDDMRAIEQNVVPRKDRLAEANMYDRRFSGNRYFRDSRQLKKERDYDGNKNVPMKKIGGKRTKRTKRRKHRTKHRTKRRKHRTKRRKHRTKHRTKRRKHRTKRRKHRTKHRTKRTKR